MYFSSISFSKNFLHKTRPNALDEENGLIIYLGVFLPFFTIYQLRILCPVDENQNLKPKDGKTANSKLNLELLNI